MTRSHHVNKEASRHMKPAARQIKKSGHGNANWGSYEDEIVEGISIVQNGGKAKGNASAAELGMSKLSTSASSTTSSFSSAESTTSSDVSEA